MKVMGRYPPGGPNEPFKQLGSGAWRISRLGTARRVRPDSYDPLSESDHLVDLLSIKLVLLLRVRESYSEETLHQDDGANTQQRQRWYRSSPPGRKQRHRRSAPPITTGEAEALIQRVGITAEQFKEVLAALTPNREIVVEDVVGGPAGGKAGPAGSQGKKKKVRRSQKKKTTKPNGKAVMEDALSRLDEESSSFERMSAFDRLRDPKSKKPRTSVFERLQDTQSARKGDLRDTLKEKRGESTTTSKTSFEERRTTVEDKGAAELWRMYEQLEKRMDAKNPYRQAVFSEVTPFSRRIMSCPLPDNFKTPQIKAVTPFSRRIMSCPLPDNFKTPQIKAYNGTSDPQDHLARFGVNVVMYAYPEEIKCRCFLATLEGQACEWFHKLPNRSIDKWSDLAHKFLEHFASSRRQKLPFSHLLNVKIWKGEQLREFINRAKYLALEEEDDEPPVRKEKKSGPPVAEGKKRKDYGFTGDTIEAEGTITVRAGVGDGTHRLWIDMEFMVVQLDCAHHLILGRPGLEDLECIISPVHLCLKFNTPTGVGVAKGNQSLSRSCYVRATKSQARVDENVSTICAAIQKEEGRPWAKPAKEVKEVSLDPTKPERKVKVGRTLPLRLKGQFLEVLQAFKVLFAWGPEDM
ncbi:unnamed protein product [Cuscuta campestris]|uniref:Retrotransposon gag domain-containing protein n=1 Tax=Cuscuta campestris TaxID=132261 RepID=A0A484MI49_9ASTE|nr:unnamed protein product [Cuscuta campestris]